MSGHRFDTNCRLKAVSKWPDLLKPIASNKYFFLFLAQQLEMVLNKYDSAPPAHSSGIRQGHQWQSAGTCHPTTWWSCHPELSPHRPFPNFQTKISMCSRPRKKGRTRPFWQLQTPPCIWALQEPRAVSNTRGQAETSDETIQRQSSPRSPWMIPAVPPTALGCQLTTFLPADLLFF